MLKIIENWVQSPVFSLIAWTAGIAVLTQCAKWGAKIAGIRHLSAVEKFLPIVPVLLGAISAAVYGPQLGLAIFVEGDQVGFGLRVFYGAGVGFVAGHAFKVAISLAPDDGKIEKVLGLYYVEPDES